MKRFLNLLITFIFVLSLSGVACAYKINYFYNLDADGNGYTSPYSGVTVETFDQGDVNGWYWYGNGEFRTGTTGTYAAPYGKKAADATQYFSVPYDLGLTDDDGNLIGSWAAVDFALGANYNYFGLWWGSVDTYNTLNFYNDGFLVETITGSEAIYPSAANGNQTAPSTNLYVNITDLPLFDSVEWVSTSYAFEVDNMAVGHLPEPASMLLLGLGLIGLAGARRLKK